MITSIVVDPDVFTASFTREELPRRELVQLLQGILENGILIDGPEREMLRAAVLEAAALSTQTGQRIALLLQECLTKHKRYVVRCAAAPWGVAGTDRVQQLTTLASTLKADAVVTTTARSKQLSAALGTQIEAIPAVDYSQSQTEARRREFQQTQQAFDQLAIGEQEERIARALRYSEHVRVYDAHLASSESHGPKFVQGIAHFLRIWDKWCVVGDRRGRQLEIYTLGDRQTQNGFLKAADALARVQTLVAQILNPLGLCTTSVVIKRDRNPPIFHARFLQAKSRAFDVDPGFDTFGGTGPMRRCFFRLNAAGEQHLLDIRGLPSVP